MELLPYRKSELSSSEWSTLRDFSETVTGAGGAVLQEVLDVDKEPAERTEGV